VSGLRGLLLENWSLKLVSLVFAGGLWIFVATEERMDAFFTVPLDLVDLPAGLDLASVGVETVVVRVEGRRSLVRRLREEDLHAELSLKNARAGRFVGRIDTDNVSAPAGVRVVHVTPSEVRATLEVK
jgi:YbbR domain-containing protein